MFSFLLNYCIIESLFPLSPHERGSPVLRNHMTTAYKRLTVVKPPHSRRRELRVVLPDEEEKTTAQFFHIGADVELFGDSAGKSPAGQRQDGTRHRKDAEKKTAI